MSELISQDAKDNLAKQLREQAMGLIPESVFSEMLNKEIDSFFHVQREVNVSKDQKYWGKDEKGNVYWNVTPFRELVWTELSNIVKDKMKIIASEAINGEGSEVNLEVSNFWNDKHTESEIKEGKYDLASIFQKSVPSLLNIMFMQQMSQLVTITQADMEDRIQNNIRNMLQSSGINTYY
jgi:hypothetical protein